VWQFVWSLQFLREVLYWGCSMPVIRIQIPSGDWFMRVSWLGQLYCTQAFLLVPELAQANRSMPGPISPFAFTIVQLVSLS
jgi:hypothetical protein